MRTRWSGRWRALVGLLGVSAAALAALGLSACPRSCACPTDSGVYTVNFPAQPGNPIVAVTTNPPCSAVFNVDEQITVTQSSVDSCHVRVLLADGEVFTFSVAFTFSNDSCCPTLHASGITIPQPADAGFSDSGVPLACYVDCATPPAPLHPLDGLTSAAATLQGRWLFCGGALPPGAPSDAEGIELDAASVKQTGPDGGATLASGNAYYLVPSAAGTVRGTGSAYQLIYDLEQSTSGTGTSTQVDFYPTPTSGFSASVGYSPCPRELELDFAEAGTGPTVLVSLPN